MRLHQSSQGEPGLDRPDFFDPTEMLAGGIAGLIVTRHPAGGVAGGILGALARGKIDDFLRALGRKVLRNPDEGVKGARRQGDLIVDGIKTEVKTLDPGATSATIRNTVNNSLRRGGQAREIIIDARGSGLTRAEAERGIARVLGLPSAQGRLDRITVLGDDFFIGGGP